MARATKTRAQALVELARRGIGGNAVYLLDVVPLLEMAWADGEVHPAERAMVLAFLDEHLSRLDAMAEATVVTRAEALRFVHRYLDHAPAPGELAALRDLLCVVRLTASDGPVRTQRILDGVMAVGGVAPSPSRAGVDWDERELEMLMELEASLPRA